MNSKKRIVLTWGVIILSVLYLKPIYSQQRQEEIENQMRLFSDVFVLIRENYVEDIEAQEIIRGAMKGMMGALDPYSQFLEPEAAELLKADTGGEFGGLGIRITSKEDIITVVTPLPDTPAFRLGIMPGDRIVRIEGESAVGLTLREAVQKLRGAPGTDIVIGIAREGVEGINDYTITREIIVPQKVYAELMDKNIGYLRLVEFTEDAPTALSEELAGLIKKGAEGLILDLRNNPGGLLGAAVDVANIFIGRGELIVYTQGRRADQNREFRARRNPVAPDLPLVVLVNKGSASGSEIVAGAIKDLSRGITLGETTFGKASVQSIIDLEDGSSLRLTTAKYYTPAGISIHDTGIVPDITVRITREEQQQLVKQQEQILGLSEEELKEREESSIIDPQLARAHDLLIARRIFMMNEKSGAAEK